MSASSAPVSRDGFDGITRPAYTLEQISKFLYLADNAKDLADAKSYVQQAQLQLAALTRLVVPISSEDQIREIRSREARHCGCRISPTW